MTNETVSQTPKLNRQQRREAKFGNHIENVLWDKQLQRISETLTISKPVEAASEAQPLERCEVCHQPKDNGWVHARPSGYGDFASVSCSAPTEVETQREEEPQSPKLDADLTDAITWWQDGENLESFSETGMRRFINALIAALPKVSTPTPSDMPPQKVRDSLISLLADCVGDSYDCTRVWEAWNVGTMSQDDFVPVSERVDEIADSILEAIGAAHPVPSDMPVALVSDENIEGIMDYWGPEFTTHKAALELQQWRKFGAGLKGAR